MDSVHKVSFRAFLIGFVLVLFLAVDIALLILLIPASDLRAANKNYQFPIVSDLIVKKAARERLKIEADIYRTIHKKDMSTPMLLQRLKIIEAEESAREKAIK